MPTGHRGPLAIHAGRSRDEFRSKADLSIIPGLPDSDGLVDGAIIGVVEVVDCVPYEAVKDRPFAEPLGWCWLLADPRPGEPIPMAGKLGLFEVELEAAPLLLWTIPSGGNPAAPRHARAGMIGTDEV